MYLTPMAGDVDLSGGWKTLWSAVTKSTDVNVTLLLSVLGVAILVVSLLMWVWQRWRGRADGSKLWSALIVGAVLAAPGIIFPIFLSVADFVANGAITLWENTGGQS